MSRKKNRRWNSTRLRAVDAAFQARFEAAVERQLDAEMKRQVALAMAREGNMDGVRLTVKTPVRDLVLEFPEEVTDE